MRDEIKEILNNENLTAPKKIERIDTFLISRRMTLNERYEYIKRLYEEEIQ